MQPGVGGVRRPPRRPRAGQLGAPHVAGMLLVLPGRQERCLQEAVGGRERRRVRPAWLPPDAAVRVQLPLVSGALRRRVQERDGPGPRRQERAERALLQWLPRSEPRARHRHRRRPEAPGRVRRQAQDLSTADWEKLTGPIGKRDPHLDRVGRSARAGVAAVRGDRSVDPVHGGETVRSRGGGPAGACIAPRATPGASCDPATDPLCGATGKQTYTKAYPGLRHLRILEQLGPSGLVASICSETFGPTMTAIAQPMRAVARRALPAGRSRRRRRRIERAAASSRCCPTFLPARRARR